MNEPRRTLGTRTLARVARPVKRRKLGKCRTLSIGVASLAIRRNLSIGAHTRQSRSSGKAPQLRKCRNLLYGAENPQMQHTQQCGAHSALAPRGLFHLHSGIKKAD